MSERSGERTVQFSVRIPMSIDKYLVRRAIREVRSKNQLLITMIREAELLDPNEAIKDDIK